MTTPVADRFVRRVFQGHVTGSDRNDRCTEHLHLLYIGMLAFHVRFTHIDNTLHVHQGADGSSSYSMLSGACFCDDTCFTHAACQQDLPDRVIDLMGTCMIQVFPFQIDLAAILFA